jgi:pimeloyl-ACP methyl ester carboxylesterase
MKRSVKNLVVRRSGIDPACANSPVFAEFLRRSRDEYAMLQPTGGGYDSLTRAVEELESAQPAWTAGDLAKITLGHRVTVVGADNDETVFVDQAEKLHEMIKGSKLVTLQSVSHFAMLQDPEQFLAAFLASEAAV